MAAPRWVEDIDPLKKVEDAERTRAKTGMAVVLGSDVAIAVSAILAVYWLHASGTGSTATELAAVLTSAFTAISTMTTAYFGIKSMSNTAAAALREVALSDDSRRVTRYVYDVDLRENVDTNEGFVDQIRSVPGVEQQSRLITGALSGYQRVRVWASRPIDNDEFRLCADRSYNTIANISSAEIVRD